MVKQGVTASAAALPILGPENRQPLQQGGAEAIVYEPLKQASSLFVSPRQLHEGEGQLSLPFGRGQTASIFVHFHISASVAVLYRSVHGRASEVCKEIGRGLRTAPVVRLLVARFADRLRN